MPPWPDDVRPITAEGLSEALCVQRIVGIHCWASWNGHDRVFAQQLSAIREATNNDIDLYMMDVEQPSNVSLILKWGILNVPAFVVIQQQRRLQTFYQANESVVEFARRILRWFESYLHQRSTLVDRP